MSPLGLGLVGVTATALGTTMFLALSAMRTSENDTGPSIHEATEAAAQQRDKRARRRVDEILADNEFLRRAVAATADLADRRGILGSVERTMRSGDIRLRPAEAIFGYLIGAAFGLVVAVVLVASSPVLAGLVAAASVLGPPFVLKRYVKRRLKKFEEQLPEMLIGLASTLRAGRSLRQGLDALAGEAPDPIGRELRKIVAEIRLGGTLVDVLSSAAERIGSKDFDWAVMAMRIQSEVGGNLSELLDQVSDTMRARTRFRGEVKALTAEGRASAMMLVMMPPGLIAFIKTSNPDYVEPLFSTTMGNVILGISAVMIVMGWFVMNKVIQVEV